MLSVSKYSVQLVTIGIRGYIFTAMAEHEPQSQIRILLFGKGLLAPTLTEEKQISLRKFRQEAHDFKKGEYFIGSFKDDLDILLQATEDTEVKLFKELSPDDVISDGFEDVQDAFEKMHIYYPELTMEDKMGLIHYEIPKINGIPVVKANK